MFGIILGIIILSAYFLFISRLIPKEKLPIKKTLNILVSAVAVISLSLGGWYGAMFYADPGYTYQVRTLGGSIKAYATPGWHYKGFGSTYPWKKAMSVSHNAIVDSEGTTSAARLPYTIRLLDRVDGKIQQTTRFRLPEDEVTFLKLAAEYRTPANLLNTELIPTVEQVITANSSLMGAEDYFNGKRNDFQLDFQTQMREGIFMVERQELRTSIGVAQTSTADASKKGKQTNYGNRQQTRFVVTKVRNKDGSFKVNKHNYQQFGISVVDAKITDFDPNADFKARMKDQQKASADRAIAREERIKEEEQKQLVIVKGDRKIAEEQAEVKRNQIKRTTEAETDKALALIKAGQLMERAEIERQAAAIQLERDRLVAKSKQVLADADKYEREARIAGDNALQQRLDAWLKAQQSWAAAAAQRAVPNTVTVLGGGNSSGVPTGANTEMQSLTQLMTLSLAKQLDIDMGLKTPKK